MSTPSTTVKLRLPMPESAVLAEGDNHGNHKCAKGNVDCIERLQQGESINKQDVKTKFFLEFEENVKLVNHISTHESRISQILKEKEQLKKDFKAREDKDIDKQISLENQVKVLSNVVYKTSQLAQTVFMLTPKPSSYHNGRCSISHVNLEYLKKAQLEKPCLYNVQYDKNDLANMFAPESEETIHIAEESRSKLDRHAHTFLDLMLESFNDASFLNFFNFNTSSLQEKRSVIRVTETYLKFFDFNASSLQDDVVAIKWGIEFGFCHSPCLVEELRIVEDQLVIRFIVLSMFSLSERLKADNTIMREQ
ncbi:hypothetical protein Tco_0419032 [Tanacetum coccineum]